MAQVCREDSDDVAIFCRNTTEAINHLASPDGALRLGARSSGRCRGAATLLAMVTVAAFFAVRRLRRRPGHQDAPYDEAAETGSSEEAVAVDPPEDRTQSLGV